MGSPDNSHSLANAPSVGALGIADERARQIQEEGWTPDHDDHQRHAEILSAAMTYARAAKIQQTEPNFDLSVVPVLDGTPWPRAIKYWKPSHDPIRNLEKAGALIAAEIDRLIRAEEATDG